VTIAIKKEDRTTKPVIAKKMRFRSEMDVLKRLAKLILHQALGFFSLTFLYQRIPNIKNIAKRTKPMSANKPFKVFFRMTKKTIANKIKVAPSFQSRI
jgi:hypothetical protein